VRPRALVFVVRRRSVVCGGRYALVARRRRAGAVDRRERAPARGPVPRIDAGEVHARIGGEYQLLSGRRGWHRERGVAHVDAIVHVHAGAHAGAEEYKTAGVRAGIDADRHACQLRRAVAGGHADRLAVRVAGGCHRRVEVSGQVAQVHHRERHRLIHSRGKRGHRHIARARVTVGRPIRVREHGQQEQNS